MPVRERLGLGQPTENPFFADIYIPSHVRPGASGQPLLPVRVFIHGGFMQFGSTSGQHYNQQFFATEQFGEVRVLLGHRCARLSRRKEIGLTNRLSVLGLLAWFGVGTGAHCVVWWGSGAGPPERTERWCAYSWSARASRGETSAIQGVYDDPDSLPSLRLIAGTVHHRPLAVQRGPHRSCPPFGAQLSRGRAVPAPRDRPYGARRP